MNAVNEMVITVHVPIVLVFQMGIHMKMNAVSVIMIQTMMVTVMVMV